MKSLLMVIYLPYTYFLTSTSFNYPISDYYRRKNGLKSLISGPVKLRRSVFTSDSKSAATVDLSKEEKKAIVQKVAEQEEDPNLTDVEILKRNLQRLIDSM